MLCAMPSIIRSSKLSGVGKKGLNLKAIVFIGKQEHIFNKNVAFHMWVLSFCCILYLILTHGPLFYWIFVPLLQAELDEFCTWWNHHRVRTQKDKTMPSGHVPADVLDHPQNYGGLD
ncbi:hypothetical protein GGX14DRAFT_668406 [Mycena pura]|uniref:Uncharacterized protein n=1 Tax=Mycena pura TaxID=153505 RepID=A0AAD6Y559_9AGAR|nr:hypothetical protein GGX14DRAFT_668406 [Mycena pura]